MKDLTATTFGLLIAFVLPGLVFLYGLTFVSRRAAAVFEGFLTAESTTGLFLLVALAALTAGLMLAIPRWIAFEKILLRKHALPPRAFAVLRTEPRLLAFQAAVDAHYRYHQFWGGMVFALPVGYWGWLLQAGALRKPVSWAVFAAVFIVLEFITGWAAAAAYRNYVGRAREILRGGRDAKRMGQEQKGSD